MSCEAWRAALSQWWWLGFILVMESLIRSPDEIKEEILQDTHQPCWDYGELLAWAPKTLLCRRRAHILKLRTLTCEVCRTEAKVAGQVSSPISAGTAQRWHFKELCCSPKPRLQTAKSSWALAFRHFWAARRNSQMSATQHAVRSALQPGKVFYPSTVLQMKCLRYLLAGAQSKQEAHTLSLN